MNEMENIKVGLRFLCPNLTDDEYKKLLECQIYIDWDLPFLPREKDDFDLESFIINSMPDKIIGLSWSVDYVRFEKINGKVTPILHLLGR